MGKKKGVILVGICICVLLGVAGVFLLQPDNGAGGNKTDENHKIAALEQAKAQFPADIKELKDGKYPNLVAKDFTASIEDVESICKFQILRNQEFETTLENINTMIEPMEQFFGDALDKSQLYHRMYERDENGEVPGDAIGEEIPYDEVIERLKAGDDKKYSFIGGFVNRGEGYAHIDPTFGNTWFAKSGSGLIGGDNVDTKEYLYITGIRQEDTTIQLNDKSYKLSELEQRVLDYVNGDAFPLPHHEEISYKIGTSYVQKLEGQEYLSFTLRRVYKGIPFEYGSSIASGGYIDKVDHDYTTVVYSEGTQPDTLMGFMGLRGIVEVTEEITEMITAGEALRLLSEQIGENSIYDVYGVELIYRNCEIPVDPDNIEELLKFQDILEPKWKIITINQNDDKYTLFYVDVVTGEITNRFEYYYD